MENAVTTRGTGAKSTNVARRNAYATQYIGCVDKVAKRLARKIPKHVEMDDLVSAGMLGLIEAAERFDPSRGERFESFAEFRIRGAMLDELRARDSLSRDMRRVSKELRRASAEVASQLGRSPEEAEVAAHMGISIDEMHARQAKLTGSSVVGYDEADPSFLDHAADEACEDPCDQAARRELFANMIEHIEALPQKMQQVLALYYCESLNLKEIGHVLGVTESRVCQIHREATLRLRASLGEAHGEAVWQTI